MRPAPEDIDEDLPDEPELPEPEPDKPEPPRLWSVFVVVLVTGGTILLVQVIAGAVLAVTLLVRGVPPQQMQTELQAFIEMPAAMIAIGLLTQLIIGLGAILPALLSPVPWI